MLKNPNQSILIPTLPPPFSLPYLESEAAVLGELAAALEVEERVGLGTGLPDDRHRARVRRRPDADGVIGDG